MFEQAVRAAVFDSRVYKEIGEGPESMFRAMGVVGATAIAFGLGIRSTDVEGLEDAQALVALMGAMTVVVGWLLWSLVVYMMGTRLFGGRAGYRMIQRAIGIAYGPGVLMVAFSVPRVGGLSVYRRRIVVARLGHSRRAGDPGMGMAEGPDLHGDRVVPGHCDAAAGSSSGRRPEVRLTAETAPHRRQR